PENSPWLAPGRRTPGDGDAHPRGERLGRCAQRPRATTPPVSRPRSDCVLCEPTAETWPGSRLPPRPFLRERAGTRAGPAARCDERFRQRPLHPPLPGNAATTPHRTIAAWRARAGSEEGFDD